MTIADHPLHRAGQAALPHPALALGGDAEPLRRPWVADGRRREPAVDVRPEALPRENVAIAAPSESASPEPAELMAEGHERRAVAGYAVVAGVSGQHCAQVRPLLGNRLRDAAPQLGLHLAELRSQPLLHRLPTHREAPVPRLRADVREAEEVERL